MSNAQKLILPLMDRRYVAVCFAIFFLIRLALLLLVPISPLSDAGWYVARGMELAQGQGYHDGPWPTAYWPVGYPAFLGAVFFLFGPHVIAAQAVNLALSCGIFFLTYRVARRIFASELAARIAILLLTIYPNQIAYTGVLFSEMLLTFVMLLGIDVFTAHPTARRAFLAGLILGFGALVKAQMLFLPCILLALYGWQIRGQSDRLRRFASIAALFLIGEGLVVLPWTARNEVALHHFILISTNGGLTFLTGNNPEAQGDYTPDSSLVPLARFSVADQVAADKRAWDLGWAWIRNNPGRFIELTPMKVWRLWAPDGEGEWWYEIGYAGYPAHAVAFRTVRVLNQSFYAVMMIGFGLTAIRLWRGAGRDLPWSTLGLWLALFTTLVSVVFSGQSRFHIPIMPWVFAYVGWTIACWITAGRHVRAAPAMSAARLRSIPGLPPR